MTHIVGLRLRNWQCFRGEHVLELGKGTYAIVARDVNDAGRSNWLGKSSLLAAIRYALEGRKPPDVDHLDDLISYGEDELLVDVELSDGTFISRKKPRGSSTDLFVKHDSSPKPLYKDPAEQAIARAIGLPPADLNSTAYAEQRQLAKLVAHENRGDLQGIVNDWLQLARLEAAGEAAGKRLRYTAKRLREVVKFLESVESRLKHYDEPALLAELERLEAEAKDHALRRANQEKRVREHNAWQELKQRRDGAVWAAEQVAQRRQALASLPEPLGDEAELKRACEQTYSAAEQAHREQRAKMLLARGEFSGVCPVNACACPVKDSINASTALNGRLLLAATQAATAATSDANRAKRNLDNYQAVARARLRAIAQLEAAEQEAKRLEPYLAQPLPPEPSMEELVGGSTVAGGVTELKFKLETVRSLQRERTEFLAEQERLRPLVVVQQAAFAVLGPEGAQRSIAERAVMAIERTANRDLQQAGIGLSLSVRWGRDTKKPAVQCPFCGTAFPPGALAKTCEACFAPRGMKVIPELRFRLSRVSGAAYDLAGLAVRCAAFKWLRARRQAPWSVAILDEPFAQVDTTHKRALSAHIQRMLDGTFDQAFVVAHDAAVLDSMPHRITITGNGQWSSAKVS